MGKALKYIKQKHRRLVTTRAQTLSRTLIERLRGNGSGLIPRHEPSTATQLIRVVQVHAGERDNGADPLVHPEVRSWAAENVGARGTVPVGSHADCKHQWLNCLQEQALLLRGAIDRLATHARAGRGAL